MGLLPFSGDYAHQELPEVVLEMVALPKTWLYALQNSAERALERLSTATEPEEIFFESAWWIPVLIPSLGALLTILLCVSCYRPSEIPARDRRPPDNQQALAARSALLTFITPTRSIWPGTYSLIAQRAVSERKSTLRLPLRSFFDDVISGTIELRCPSSDLPAFISDTYRYQGWTISFDIGLSWRSAVFLRVMFLRLASALPLISGPPASAVSGPRSVSGSNLTSDTERSKSARTLSDSPTPWNSRGVAQVQSVLLDAVPYPRLKAYIRYVQALLVPESSTGFGFSTLGPSASHTGASFVVASVPFLPRKHLSRSKDKFRQLGPNPPNPSPCGSLDLELTPLLTSLEAIIKLLTSGSWPFVVESVQNVSEQYASYLDAYVQDITYNPRVRERFVSRWGMEGWREERLLVGWEAALFRAGFLTRWAVLVHKTERVD